MLDATVAPGNAVGLTVTLQNIGTQVRTFSVDVRGAGHGLLLPHEWVTIVDPDIELNPFHHPDPSTGTTAIVVAVPVDNRWPAGDYGFVVSVTTVHEGEVKAVAGTLRVEQRFNAVATAAPLIATARRRARFKVGVLNNGNFPFVPALKLTDAEERLRFEPDPAAPTTRKSWPRSSSTTSASSRSTRPTRSTTRSRSRSRSPGRSRCRRWP